MYVIEATVPGDSASRNGELTIGIGPVALPEYLDRKEILTHDQDYRVNAAEFDRWAEPLEHNIASALATNLSMLGPAENVVTYPWGTVYEVDYVIHVRVHAYGTSPSGEVLLSASWVVLDAENKAIKLSNNRYTETRQGDDVVATVAAMSRALEQLSRDIADVLVVSAARSTTSPATMAGSQR